ncbi:hypothetical protein ACFQ4C_12100 [Larkinella insperata]|uniref:Uncharacterized protein n=1 Tax=Larkinella insperata TaxID=332158 RepID=A0ABW3Q7F1_9BACT|nr:hypothetical protein [Larkinella insperata]
MNADLPQFNYRNEIHFRNNFRDIVDYFNEHQSISAWQFFASIENSYQNQVAQNFGEINPLGNGSLMVSIQFDQRKETGERRLDLVLSEFVHATPNKEFTGQPILVIVLENVDQFITDFQPYNNQYSELGPYNILFAAEQNALSEIRAGQFYPQFIINAQHSSIAPKRSFVFTSVGIDTSDDRFIKYRFRYS